MGLEELDDAMGVKSVRDRITGFTGTITAICRYVDGRIGVLIEKLDHEGRPIEMWVSSERVEDDA